MELNELRNYFANDLGWGTDGSAHIIFEFLLRIRERARGGVLLDAGAGYQRYRPFFSESIYLAQEHPVAGIANKKINKFDILSDVKLIPLKDNSVDCVLSTSSLEHYEFPERFFEEAYRVLKPGGVLFISVPFTYPEHEIPYDFQRPTRYGLMRWYNNAGFKEVNVKPTTSSTHAATIFIKDAALYEGSVGIRKAMANDIILAIKLIPRYVVYYLMVWPSIWLLKKTVNNRPSSETLFPTGWVSEGVKAGGYQVDILEWKNKEDFLRERILKGVGFELRDNAILPIKIL